MPEKPAGSCNRKQHTMASSLSNSYLLRYGPWYLKISKTVKLCKNLRDWLKYGNPLLQNVPKIRCKYWFHLIKHTPSPIIRFCVSLVLLLLWLTLIIHTYYLVWAIVFFKLTVNKVFNPISLNIYVRKLA